MYAVQAAMDPSILDSEILVGVDDATGKPHNVSREAIREAVAMFGEAIAIAADNVSGVFTISAREYPEVTGVVVVAIRQMKRLINAERDRQAKGIRAVQE